MRILIVEDEKEIADGIDGLLTKEGYTTDIARDGLAGLDLIMSGVFDLILLDIMLPKINGLDILKSIRKEGMQTPVILLTAKSQVEDKILGLDLGADDYLSKPFDGRELLARIRARVRSISDTREGCLTAFDISLDISTYKLAKASKSVKLSKTEYQLLEYLMINKGQILSRDMIISRVWDHEDAGGYNSLEVYVSFLRKKLKFVNASAEIVTKKGIGYSLVMEEN